MSFSYKGTIFDKRGCYVILPASPFWRIDSTNDNAAEGDEEVEVLEGPEVEITDSCEPNGKEQTITEMEHGKSADDEDIGDSDNVQCSQQAKKTAINGKKAKTEPDNKYYEVEAILDGPRKRREHLFKLCYKVRWKGYGPDADTWQPIADLTNVQDMIDDYNKEKSLKREQKKPVMSNKLLDTNRRMRSRHRSPPSVKYECGDGKKQYDPVYGTVKDKFWKDLELGRHQNHHQMFSADMYSKVKGCRRAAHTEAIVNIHKQHNLHNKSHASTSRSSRHLHDDYLRRHRSSSASSQQMGKSRSKSPVLLPASGMRKRSSDPFSAEGYICAKRSRRLREAKNCYSDQDSKQLSISSVTSETMGIVAMSSPLTPSVESDNKTISVFSNSSPTAGETSDSDDGTEDVSSAEAEQTGRMTVSSETMLTVTTETKRLDPETRFADEGSQVKLCHHVSDSETLRLNRGGNCQFHLSNMNFGASGDENENLEGMSFGACGATSDGELPVRCEVKRTLCMKRSILDAQSEANGAVERSHDEDCLWNGACNRSDCKSNRRRNMKNGQGKSGGTIPPESDDDQNVEGENVESHMEDNEDNMCTNEGGGSYIRKEDSHLERETDEDDQDVGIKHSASEDRKTSSESTNDSNVDTPCDQPGSSSKFSAASFPMKVAHSKSKSSASYTSSDKSSSKASRFESQSSAQNRRLLFSSAHADSSDSSFDEGLSSGASLSREAVSDSFGRMDAVAHRLYMNISAGSTTSRTVSHGSSAGHESPGGGTSRGSAEVRKHSIEIERPGLFSENNSAFIFTRQDSEDDSCATPSERLEEPIVHTKTVGIDLSYPGKENFSSSNLRTSGTAISKSPHFQTGMNVRIADSNTATGSQSHSQSSQSGAYSDRTEGLTRKRSCDVFQPLEKISSPNARESELDQRIVTLTCDDLEDFVEQGKECYKQRDTSFISNADLIQAVNLNKAEVVKRAVLQFNLNEHKLDFEQPDITGVTLLMRAVQRGNVAIAEMLLEHGVSVNAQQTNGTTALMIAAEQNSTCLVALLLKYGANSSLYMLHSDQAETALMKAIKKQHREVVSLMLRVGVNIASPTCTSLSALELSVERRNPAIEGIVRFHCQRLDQAFRNRVLITLEGTANLLEPLFALQCFPLRESNQFVVKFNSNIHPVAPGEGFILFIAHTKITEKGVKCRFHGGCPISSVMLNGVAQSPLTKEVNFVTSCHPIIHGCNTLVIHKMADYTSKAKLVVQAFRARLLHG